MAPLTTWSFNFIANACLAINAAPVHEQKRNDL